MPTKQHVEHHHKEGGMVVHHHYKKGGKVKESVKENDDRDGMYKRGGKVNKLKKLAVDGKAPKARADRRSRGGVISAAGMTPESPLSGAGKTAKAKAPVEDKEDD